MTNLTVFVCCCTVNRFDVLNEIRAPLSKLTESKQREESEVSELLQVEVETLQLGGGQFDVVEGGEEGPDPAEADGVPLETGLKVGGCHREEGGEVQLVATLDESQEEEAGPGGSQHAHLHHTYRDDIGWAVFI